MLIKWPIHVFFKKMGQSRPLFVYFRSFLVLIQIEKSVDGVLGIQTWGRMMVGADKTTELWQLASRETRFSRFPPVKVL